MTPELQVRFVVGDLAFNVFSCEVFQNQGGNLWERVGELTNREFRTAFYLAVFQGVTKSRADILEAVDPGTSLSLRNVDARMVQIRQKLGAIGKRFQGVYNQGYFYSSVIQEAKDGHPGNRQPPQT